MDLFEPPLLLMSPLPGPEQSPTPQQPEPSQSVAQPERSGGCFKSCLGYGCLTAVVFFILSSLGAGCVYLQGPSYVDAEDWNETLDVVQEIQGILGRGSTYEDRRIDSALDDIVVPSEPDFYTRGASRARAVDRFFTNLEEPVLSQRDFEVLHSELVDWGESQTVSRFDDSYEEVYQLHDADRSILYFLRVFFHGSRLIIRVNALGREYHERFGNPEDQRQAQLVAIARASHNASGDHKPWEQNAADAMLEVHDEGRDDYLELRQLFRKGAEGGEQIFDDLSDEKQTRLIEAFSEQFTMIISAINRDSLVAWTRLTNDERQAIIEEVSTRHHWIGLPVAASIHNHNDDARLLYVRLLEL